MQLQINLNAVKNESIRLKKTVVISKDALKKLTFLILHLRSF